METKLIILEQGNIIVSDEKIKEGDFYYRIESPSAIITKASKVESELLNRKTTINDGVKLIASDNPEHNLPRIDYSLLYKEDSNRIGYIDIEKLAEDSYINENRFYDDEVKEIKVISRTQYKQGWRNGFKKSKSLNDKKFSLEDVIGVMRHIFNQEVFYGETIEETLRMRDDSMFDYIKFLQQPKVFDIEIETDSIPVDRSPTGWDTFPKIINNQIKITKILC